MRYYFVSLALLVLSIESIVIEAADEVKYSNPVRSAQEDEVTSLPGLTDKINFRQFSGYLKASNPNNGTTKRFLHYWFVESQSDPANDPLILWLNGGPGCSSLGGFFTELGPFRVNDDGKTLSLNGYSWNKKANVIFLESPTGVGFSYSTSILPEINTDDSTAKLNYLALKSFFRKFPQYKPNPFYITGESYGGVYVPTLASLVDADSDINLRGLAIGNGYMDAAKLGQSLVLFAYHHGLFGETLWKRLSTHCCHGMPLSRENCDFASGLACKVAVRGVQASMAGINPYNILANCLHPQVSVNMSQNVVEDSGEPVRRSKRELIAHQLRRTSLDALFAQSSDARMQLVSMRQDDPQLAVEPPCFDDHTLINYLNQAEVRNAIHIPRKVKSWDTCSIIIYVMKYAVRPGGVAPIIKQLLASKRGLKVTIYNGDVDTVCNFLGNEWFTDDLNDEVVNDYLLWKTKDGQVGGGVKRYNSMSYFTVRGSGHMVPGDRPELAEAILNDFLSP